MPGRKGAKRSVKTANIDIEPKDLLHDDLIDIVKIPSQTYDLLKEETKILPQNQVI